MRERPLVQVVRWDGTPLRPLPVSQRKDARVVCQKAAGEVRAHARARADGGLVPPVRAAATEADRRRCDPPAGSVPKPRPKPKPEPVNDPSARSMPHPSGNLENDKPQHALHEAMLRGSSHRVLRPNARGADVQVISVADTRDALTAAPIAQVVYVRLSSCAWTLDAAPVTQAITGTVARVLARGGGGGGGGNGDSAQGGGHGYDNATVATDPSGGVYVNHGVRAPDHAARARLHPPHARPPARPPPAWPPPAACPPPHRLPPPA